MHFSFNYKENYKSKHSVTKFMNFSTGGLLITCIRTSVRGLVWLVGKWGLSLEYTHILRMPFSKLYLWSSCMLYGHWTSKFDWSRGREVNPFVGSIVLEAIAWYDIRLKHKRLNKTILEAISFFLVSQGK